MAGLERSDKFSRDDGDCGETVPESSYGPLHVAKPIDIGGDGGARQSASPSRGGPLGSRAVSPASAITMRSRLSSLLRVLIGAEDSESNGDAYQYATNGTAHLHFHHDPIAYSRQNESVTDAKQVTVASMMMAPGRDYSVNETEPMVSTPGSEVAPKCCVKMLNSVWGAYMSKQAKLMALLSTIAALISIAVCGAVIWREYTCASQHSCRRMTIHDPASVCDEMKFTDVSTGSVAYSATSIIVGNIIAAWYCARAVRLEKGALLIVFGFIVSCVIAKVAFFAFVIAPDAVSDEYALAARIGLLISSALMLISLGFALPASRQFGWRMYAKGVTRLSHIQTLKRYKQLDACAKFDLFLSASAMVSMFFFVSAPWFRYAGVGIAGMTIIALLSINNIVKRRRVWLLYVFPVVAVLLPSFYIAMVVMEEAERDGVSCRASLTACLTRSNLTLVAPGEKFPHTPDSSRQSTCQRPHRAPCWWTSECMQNNVTESISIQLSANCTEEKADVEHCCGDFGQCKLRHTFFEGDRPMVWSIAVIGIVTRCVTLVLAFRQMREMQLPGIQEMLRRGEENIRDFRAALQRL